MPLLTTGVIENTAPSGGQFAGIRPTQTFTVKIANHDVVPATIEIRAFFVSGINLTLYGLNLISLLPAEVAKFVFFANFDEFGFEFFTSSGAVKISTWGKDADGNLTTAHRLVADEIEPIP